ncbi:MAG: hypothetical protein K6T85_11480 [Gorillibacterium sp.]|nr:hypothetical protein [Gorillibacterium sp.]
MNKATSLVNDVQANGINDRVNSPMPSDQEKQTEVMLPKEEEDVQESINVFINQPILVAEGQANNKHPGKEVTVRLWQVEGKLVQDPEPGPQQGAYRFGQFDLVATRSDGIELSRFRLNRTFSDGELAFQQKEPFAILFDDYNEDGEPDFALGQRAGSNGSEYTIMTLGENGFSILESNIYSGDNRSSIRYRKVGAGKFINIYYDNSTGYNMEVVREWINGGFTRREATVALEARSAGMTDEEESVYAK